MFKCGDCALVGSFHIKGHDGKPICCRCRKHPDTLKMVTQPACLDFEKGNGTVPESVQDGKEWMKFAGDRPGKVVPVFDPQDPRKVLRYIPAEEFRRMQLKK